ncbi:helix-turn-helix transcriptional regulator [Paenibacillus sp. sptzw28]|uniref:helix-turn-helix transcriptional regulator n=1 Tax=Paenibacillus sp. sptzw28 TaxID=715179 RepID=UPI001C6E3E25|nr:helix-turn-helix transcriptional regulator [Paenibacillus sp. sptzw28]QYR19395.1 helix-turn-helix transcriptional regulator [Paenibacillus sp. sptzw28]
MIRQFEEVLPVKFIALDSRQTEEWVSPYFQIIWSAASERAPNENDFLFVPPNVPVRRFVYPTPFKCIQFLCPILETSNSVARFKMPVEIPSSLYASSSFTMISAAAAAPSSEYREFRLSCSITSLVIEIMEYLERQHKLRTEPTKKSNSDFFKNGRALIYSTRYMRKNMSNPHLSLTDIAGAIGYNSNYFCHEFSKIFTVSPIRFLNNLRLNRALQLLEHSELNVKTISKLVGVTSSSRLSSMVKAASGMTPIKYKRSKRTQFNQVR